MCPGGERPSGQLLPGGEQVRMPIAEGQPVIQWTLRETLDATRGARLADALRTVSDLVRLGGDDVEAWAAMAQLAWDRDTALTCWREVLRLRPGDPRALRQLAMLGEVEPEVTGAL